MGEANIEVLQNMVQKLQNLINEKDAIIEELQRRANNRSFVFIENKLAAVDYADIATWKIEYEEKSGWIVWAGMYDGDSYALAIRDTFEGAYKAMMELLSCDGNSIRQIVTQEEALLYQEKLAKDSPDGEN